MRKCFDRHGCDKGHRHGYESVYEPIFKERRNDDLLILEIGVFAGASIDAWVDYFPGATICCVDTFERLPPECIDILKHPRVLWRKHDSTTPVDCWFNDIAGHGRRFDFIIDDGSHTFSAQRKTFEMLKPLADRYFIEDVWSLDHMTDKQKGHNWLTRDGYSEHEYRELMDALDGYDVTYHDCRRGHQPDSFIYEVS